MELQWKWLEKRCEAPQQPGVYQIYGKHPVYGKHVLLYIGQAENLYDRLNKVHEFIPGDDGEWSEAVECLNPYPHKLYIAQCAQEELDEVEKLLIFAHSPAWNCDHIRWYHNIAKDFCIYNRGDDRQNLYKEVKVLGGKLTMKREE